MRYLCARILVLILILFEMDKDRIERAAIRAVEDYIDHCPKLVPNILSNDKTPIWDGEIYVIIAH